MSITTLSGAEFFDGDSDRISAQLITEAFQDLDPFRMLDEAVTPHRQMRVAPYIGGGALGMYSPEPGPRLFPGNN